MIVLEGPDGAGKSTLLEQLISRLDAQKAKILSKPEPTVEAMNARVEESLRVAKENPKLIFDRFGYISEQVYGPILRGKNLFDVHNKEANRFYGFFKSLKPVIIYCRPERSTIIKNAFVQKAHDTDEHMAKLREQIINVIRSYDELMVMLRGDGFTVYNYDWEVDNVGTLATRISSFLKL